MKKEKKKKLLTHALCQLPVAFITLLSPLREEMKVLLHVQCVIITKRLRQQWEFLPVLSAGILESCYIRSNWLCVKSACVCFHGRRRLCLQKIASPLVFPPAVNVPLKTESSI